MKRIILVSDLDGTLLDKQSRIHPRDAALLASLPEEVTFIPATGRGLVAARYPFHINGLVNGASLPFPAVLMNGAAVYAPGEQILGVYPFPRPVLEQVIALAHALRGVTYFFSTPERDYYLWLNDYSIGEVQKYGMDTRPLTSNDYNLPFTKVMCFSDNPELLKEVEFAAAKLKVVPFYSLPTIFEMCPPGMNKAVGLQRLLHAMQVSGVTICAAGDGENDIALLRSTDLSFAPTASPAHIRTAARYVIEPAENGILTPMLQAAGFEI